MSNIRADWPHSLSPGGISTNGYNGHVGYIKNCICFCFLFLLLFVITFLLSKQTFWDAETWMYPTLLLFYPSLAAG